MKTALIFIVLIAMSCTKASDPAPAASTITKPTSLEGKWTFTIKSVSVQASGNFRIVTISGSPTVDETYGHFTINGKTYNIGIRQKMEVGSTPGSFSRFWLIASDQSEFVFDDSQVSADFTTITAKKFFYFEGNNNPTQVYTETVIISRE